MLKPGNYLTILFALTTALAVAFVVRAQQRIATLDAEVAKLAGEKADREKQLVNAQQRARDLDAELAALRDRSEREGSLEGLAANHEGPSSRPGRVGRRNWEGQRADSMAMMANPEIAKVIAAGQRSQLDGQYAALFKSLKLSPAALDKFKDLLVEKQNSMRDVMSAARAQGLDPRQSRDEIRQLVSQSNSELDSSIQSMLGTDGFNQYKQYEQTLPQRSLVSQLDQRLSYTATPLSASQSEQLVQILAQNPPQSQSDSGGLRGMNGNLRAVPISEQAVAQAGSVLTPAQVAALQQIQVEQEAQRKVFQSIRNGGAVGAPGTTNPAPATPSPAPVNKPTG